MALLNNVKAVLRVTHNALDDAEIKPLIEAAKMELEVAGVVNIKEDDPLVERYVTAYCKAHFGYDNPDAARLEAVANSLKNTLTQLEKYKTPDPAKDGDIDG